MKPRNKGGAGGEKKKKKKKIGEGGGGRACGVQPDQGTKIGKHGEEEAGGGAHKFSGRWLIYMLVS